MEAVINVKADEEERENESKSWGIYSQPLGARYDKVKWQSHFLVIS